MENTWEFVEKYFPNYTGSSLIAREGDLSKLIEDDYEKGDTASKLLETDYRGDITNPHIEIDLNEARARIYQIAIEGYIQAQQKCVLRVAFGNELVRALDETGDALEKLSLKTLTKNTRKFFGEIKEIEFDTLQEMNAYRRGLDDMNGWEEMTSTCIQSTPATNDRN